jgi:hypothetical protein
MNTLLAYFSRQSRMKLLVIGYLLVVVILGLDYVTGEKFSFSIFYLIPILFIAWFSGKTNGVLVALASAGAWLLADLLVSKSPLHPIFPIWNTAVMFGIFLLFVFLLVALKKALAYEKELARQIQQRLLPKAIPQIHGYEIATAWQPADTVAGDYFDVMPLNDHALGLCIADASGHGMPAALLMSNLQAGVRLLASPNLAPHELCEKLNQLVCRNVTAGHFITFFYGLLDETRNKLFYTNAGHNPPILLHADGSAVALDKGGMPLGVMAGQQYHQAEVDLIAGSRLVLYTDGLVECHDLKEKAFGEKDFWPCFPSIVSLTLPVYKNAS